MRLLFPAMLLLAAPLLCQPDRKSKQQAGEEAQTLQDIHAFETWLQSYQKGAFRLMRNDRDDPDAYRQLDATLAALARWNNMVAARKLFEAASVQPELPGKPSSSERVTFYRELQPWRVRALARKHLAAMKVPELEEWLVSLLHDAFSRPDQIDEPRIGAAMRVLGARGRVPGLLALLEATQRLPKEQRVRAVNALSQIATLETVPHFIGLLRDAEPNVRIAALNAIGKALGPYTDETAHDTIDPEAGKQRDAALARIKSLLLRDKVWQVRAAAAENLVRLKTKLAVPILIDGLKAELRRKKDPWAMDMRLHRLLEGLTGQKMLAGRADQWERFWRDNGAAFTLTASKEKAEKTAAASAKNQRLYRKFFSLDLQSDRLLFVIDFSGSMNEVVKLKTSMTGSPAGQSIVKAKLVVRELKRIITSLPDGTLFNIVVFSDDVRVWREREDGRPRLVRLDDETRDDLLGSYLDSLQPAGPTNLYGALSRALGFDEKEEYDKRYDGETFDTVYIMSDGAPTWGKVIDTEQILAKVREVNALRQLTINTITFGDLNEMRFLEKLAEENGGRHIHVE